MATETGVVNATTSLGTYLRSNIRDYGLLIALVVIMIFFQIITGGVLFRPVNITNSRFAELLHRHHGARHAVDHRCGTY